MAPDFVVVAGPNAWQKRVQAERQASKGTGDGRGEVYFEIWGELITRLKQIDPKLPPGRPQPQNWLRLRGGDIFMTFSGQGPRVEIYIDQDDAKGNFDLVHLDRAEIEQTLGPLSWERLDDKRASRIAAYTEGSWTATGGERSVVLDWLINMAMRFRATLQPRIDEARRRYGTGERAPEPAPAPIAPQDESHDDPDRLEAFTPTLAGHRTARAPLIPSRPVRQSPARDRRVAGPWVSSTS